MILKNGRIFKILWNMQVSACECESMHHTLRKYTSQLWSSVLRKGSATTPLHSVFGAYLRTCFERVRSKAQEKSDEGI